MVLWGERSLLAAATRFPTLIDRLYRSATLDSQPSFLGSIKIAGILAISITQPALITHCTVSVTTNSNKYHAFLSVVLGATAALAAPRDIRGRGAAVPIPSGPSLKQRLNFLSSFKLRAQPSSARFVWQ